MKFRMALEFLGVIPMAPKPVKPNRLAIDALKPTAEKYETSVIGYPGLIVRVWPNKKRVFLYRHRQDGNLHRIALRAVTLAEAITEWSQERQAAKQGVDVAGRRQEERQQKKLKRISDRRDPTVAELASRYVVEYAKRHKRSWEADKRFLDRLVVPDLGPVKAKSVRRADVHALVHRIARKTPIQANRVLAVVRKLFSFALDAGVIESHPCLRMKAPAAENARVRVLTDLEIKTVWNASATLLDPTVADALRLQLLTACRISEVIRAVPAEFDLKAGVWTVPGSRTKNKLDHVVPLTDSAAAIVRARCAAGEYLFAWPTAMGCLAADVMSHQLLDALPRLDLQHFTTHDLRRTVATRLSELGIDREVRERVLNHKDRSVMGIHYDKYDKFKEKHEALTAWARLLDSIVSSKASQVVELRQRSAKRRAH
ncbi:MAG: site-specific integrase [Proteobacteria bacterium]|nr:site-specific integrase [Pseudomonadota bacterium]